MGERARRTCNIGLTLVATKLLMTSFVGAENKSCDQLIHDSHLYIGSSKYTLN
ncbi:hypothetical protein DPMN_194506 [Dreissena polymorpha]|uniref:Uncharacterized protein n=1 Tax=Dreissena polymorpha TaxID=45954 RepID=A0A9D4BGJ0_DREPO|nr:hypothetical protein DPMN_194506 [Dreissena polymorpha]